MSIGDLATTDLFRIPHGAFPECNRCTLHCLSGSVQESGRPPDFAGFERSGDSGFAFSWMRLNCSGGNADRRFLEIPGSTGGPQLDSRMAFGHVIELPGRFGSHRLPVTPQLAMKVRSRAPGRSLMWTGTACQPSWTGIPVPSLSK
jgi:hypothetical protein